MAKFLNTSATNYILEELIKKAQDKVILISPFLKLNDRIKELLEDKNRLKIDIRIVYGKSQLQPKEADWLEELEFVRTSFCKNLHAKCYISESAAIITSMNLYEFSQVNNNEMGIYISRARDAELYRDTCEEALRIIRVSEEVKTTLENTESTEEQSNMAEDASEQTAKLTTSKLAKQMNLKTSELLEKLLKAELLEDKGGKNYLTDKGKEAGGEFKYSKKFGPYFIWPEDLLSF